MALEGSILESKATKLESTSYHQPRKVRYVSHYKFSLSNRISHCPLLIVYRIRIPQGKPNYTPMTGKYQNSLNCHWMQFLYIFSRLVSINWELGRCIHGQCNWRSKLGSITKLVSNKPKQKRNVSKITTSQYKFVMLKIWGTLTKSETKGANKRLVANHDRHRRNHG